MKKIALLCMALVLALGGLGIGYAHWTETLEITGDVNTGYIDVNFMSQYDNDADVQGDDSLDPRGPGEWDFTVKPPEWSGSRIDKHVAQTTSTFDQWDGEEIPVNPSGNGARIIVTNGYPSYWGSVAWDIKNHGNVPVELWKVTLVQVSKGSIEIPKDIALETGTRYYVDADTGFVHVAPINVEADDFSFILSKHDLEQLDPLAWDPDDIEFNTVGYLDVTVHIEQAAAQKSHYDFVIEYLFANWNEVP